MNGKQKKLLRWYGRMVEASDNLLPADRADLEQWEQLRLPLGLATSDWPGWQKYIGKCPVASVRMDDQAGGRRA